MTKIKIVVYTLILTALFSGCASKFDQKSYDRQNNAAEKSQDSL